MSIRILPLLLGMVWLSGSLPARAQDDLSASEDEAIAQLSQLNEQERKLKFYGFTDFLLSRIFIDKDSRLYGLIAGDESSFMVWHMNLYLDRQLSDTFRALGEVRFLFSPMGNEESMETPFGGSYVRDDDKVYDLYSGQNLQWGGIKIERVWLEYKPADYLSLKVGRFLTPFGIWNVDHGSPVIIPIRQPYLVITGNILQAQTGLYASGRWFLGHNFSLDYGLTLSNGRGPVPSMDFDDNKAFGLRLKLAYEGAFKFSLGTYLYPGAYTDRSTKIESFEPFQVSVNRTIWYDEQAMALDMVFDWEDLLIQAEYIRRLVRYHEGFREPTDPTATSFKPDNAPYAAYLLLAYRLPIDGVELRPYLMAELNDNESFSSEEQALMITGGINWRINAYVVWKLESSWVNFWKSTRDNFTMVSTQLATSF